MVKAYFFLFLGFLFLGVSIFWGGKLAAMMPKKTSLAALQVSSIPQAEVFLDDQNLGKSPLENENLPPGEYTLRLIPEGIATSSWERRIKLYPRVLTAVNYLFGPTEKESAGEILTLERTGERRGEMVVLSDPDGASFSLDGKPQGVTPKNLGGFETGEHEISFSYPDFQERSFSIRTATGYKLLVNVKLAGIIVSIPPLTNQGALQQARILETPTGWLRVRAQPSLSASETARLNWGEVYPLLEEKPDWFKIQYEKDGEKKEGWISSQYSEKVKDFQPNP